MSSIAVKRMKKEIQLLGTSKLNEEGIFFDIDEADIFHIHVLFLGPKNTPYANGIFVFEFFFNHTNHPHVPPKVIFHQGYTTTRIHPNFYTDGKVCLSILNTWAGPRWSSCQTIISIIRTIQTLFDDNPLQYEPGFQTHTDTINHTNFALIVKFQNIYNNYLIAKKLKDDSFLFPAFTHIIENHLRETHEETIENIKSLEKHEGQQISIRIYSICQHLYVSDLKKKYTSLSF